MAGEERHPDGAGLAPDVPAGYRRTEVGMIPEDWEVVRASDVGRFGGGSGFPVRYQGQAQGDYPFFKVSDMSRDGNELLLHECPNYITDHTRQRLRAVVFPPQSIAFAKVGAAVFLERKRILAKPSCLDNNMAAFVLTDGRGDVLFAYYLFLSTRLSSLASTTALPSLGSVALCGLHLPLPPLPEQRAIAAVLSDVDELIGSLEALIAKKRAIKQAAMQQLLTGRTRLPGFEGEWDRVRAGDIGRFGSGSGFPVRYQGRGQGDYPFFKVSDMNRPGNERLLAESRNYITDRTRQLLGAVAFPLRSIVFAKVGAAVFLERKRILANPSCLDNNMAAFMLTDGKADSLFIYCGVRNIVRLC